MRKTYTIAIVCILAIIAFVGIIFYQRHKLATTPDVLDTTVLPGNEMIEVASPLPHTLVSSPLVVTGKARGGWYFEASFPVKVVDANGKVLAQAPAQAQGEWTTPEFVPFKVSLTFAKPTTPTGKIILEKDNPSGLPENDASISIPISFDLGTTSSYGMGS